MKQNVNGFAIESSYKLEALLKAREGTPVSINTVLGDIGNMTPEWDRSMSKWGVTQMISNHTVGLEFVFDTQENALQFGVILRDREPYWHWDFVSPW